MAAYEGLVLCSLLLIFSPAEGKELNITCVNSEDCVLPCQFQSDGKGARIMWYREDAVVTCKRFGDDSFIRDSYPPSPEYKGRTWLYKDQVLKGNATLVLRNVTLKDEGTYRCVAFTASRDREKSAVVTVHVKAPVSKVDIQQEGNRITCSSEGIYPEPELTWSTNPPSNMTFKNSTTVQQTEQQLYNINSSLTVSENITGLNYSCTVSTDTNRMTATLFKPNSCCVIVPLHLSPREVFATLIAVLILAGPILMAVLALAVCVAMLQDCDWRRCNGISPILEDYVNEATPSFCEE